ncbi:MULTISPECIES: hypothetical protein [Pseudoxanthomonas]|jgi:hypothetical protein|uniref:hypothetical protein n=1 Tax=Pseudoxanthomonas TaxID=83618 RepID=UPI00161EC6D1|nr:MULTISPECIES: hypothetical protein [Pseudoxanthomonas]MBB3274551.1 hypothetical protein [Pseudoxanthomonas sp. OG2]MBD9378226.1 hypothetical protein [Pseudoxanthomonas sp. PXM04]MBV7475057.1 hypothetical protein [Pseudoxanthomonas sp. PXM05]UBB27143.1 hypothetical protein LAG73_08740 [Pseudoxanthomonas japonensis]
MTAVSMDALFAQLQAMHDSLQNGDLDTVQGLLDQHDRDVRDFMQAPQGRDTGTDTLSNLLYAQLQLQDRLRDARDAAARKLRESQQAERAARAYLSTPGA